MKHILLILTLSATSLLCAQEYQWTPADEDSRFEQTLVNPMPTIENNAVTTYDAYPTTQGFSGRRNAAGDDPFGGGDIGDVEDPKDPKNPSPIGDMPMALVLFFVVACVLYTRHQQTSSHKA